MYFYYISMYSYCTFMYLHRASWHSSATLTEVYPCFFLSCKANSRVKPAEAGHGHHSYKIFVLFYVLFVSFCVFYLCVNVYCTVLYCTVLYCTVLYCTTATGWLPNSSQQIYQITFVF